MTEPSKASAADRETSRCTVALVQMACQPDKAANLRLAEAKIAEAAERGANVVCLQELFASRYPCQSEDHAQFHLAEPIPGPSSATIAAAAKRHRVVVVGSFFERRTAGVFHNTAVVFDTDGHEAGRYRKMHIPDDPLYYEKFYFAPGDLGFRCIPTSQGPLGVCVCWDQWFPEAARLTALRGAQILFYPTAIGWIQSEKEDLGESQHSAWETMLRSHAIANGIYVAAPNRVGCEGALEFWGGSFICDPYGNILSKASDNQPEVVIAECDLTLVETARTHWPFLRDRRIDAYEGLQRRCLDENGSDPNGTAGRGTRV
jgi:N-carbamoylputrescine amidase